MTVRKHHRGASLIEMLVVLSIITTLVVIAVPSYQGVRQALYEAHCREQLMDVGDALRRYRDDNRGLDPGSLTALAPKWVASEKLVCPLVRARAPEAVAKLNQIRSKTKFRVWASYFMFNRRGLDKLYEKGDSPFSYTQVLRQRVGRTPLVCCFDHREPHSLWYGGLVTPDGLRAWYAPERPVLVLRQNDVVDTSRYGGLTIDGTAPGTLAYLLNL